MRFIGNALGVLVLLFGLTGPALAADLEVSIPGLRREAPFDRVIREHVRTQVEDGRQIFRFDTFGDEDFWGGLLRLHEAIETVSPRTALAVGLKVDVDALPGSLRSALRHGRVDLDDPANTLALLKLNAVLGVTGFFDQNGHLRSMGIQCALCHSTVDDSLAPGIGRRLDGWANRDLNVGAIVALAPDLSTVANLLGIDDATVRRMLGSWGPGKFDAEVFLDGKAFREDGKSAATLIPPAFGLAGVNLHTWTGWGNVTYWNAFVANLEMHGKGTFFDPRLDNAAQFPIAAKAGFGHLRTDPDEDRITPKLPALQYYQLSIPAPKPRPGIDFDREPAAREGGRGETDEVVAVGCEPAGVTRLARGRGAQPGAGAVSGPPGYLAAAERRRRRAVLSGLPASGRQWFRGRQQHGRPERLCV